MPQMFLCLFHYMIYNCYCNLFYRRWKHESFLNSKQNYEPNGCHTKIKKTQSYSNYIQKRTFIKFLVPELGTNNKKFYRDKKLIG